MTQRSPTAAPPVSSAPLLERQRGRSAALSPLGRAVRLVLTHPLALAVKAPLKDALWTARGRKLVNPAIPPNVRSILFVCKGNICRSPFAARRAAQMLASAGSSIRCGSAGIDATQAQRPPEEAFEAARAFGVGLEAHTPVQLTPVLVSQFDVIVVMEAAQLMALRQSYPNAADRICLLSLLDDRHGYAKYHIADPFGKPRPTFDACYRRIDQTLRSLLELVAPQAR